MKRRVPEELTRALGQTVRALRLKRGLNRVQLAIRMGVSPNYVSKIETRGQGLALGSLVRFADALDTAPWNLLRCAELRLARQKSTQDNPAARGGEDEESIHVQAHQ